MKKSLSTLICILMISTLFVSFLSFGCSPKNMDNNSEDSKGNHSMPSDYVYTDGGLLFDANGNQLTLRGTNIGNWLVPEGWMGIIEIDGQNDDVNGKKLTFKKMMNAFSQNPNNFSEEEINQLLDIYYESWFTESDVSFIKESGFNCIRLPFGYFNIEDEDGNLKKDAFKWIDKCLEWCAKYELYCILDLHGAYGSQNKEHHSGDDTQCILFDDEYAQERTQKLWKTVAERYKNNTWVLGYDLLNEPTGLENQTKEAQHKVHKNLYDAVREVDKNHIILIESCWTFADFPDPQKYALENVIYQMHMYNWNNDTSMYLFYHLAIYRSQNQINDKPVLVGEFCIGDGDLKITIDTFEKHNWSWTTWNFKTNNRGGWGLHNINNERINISSASYQEIAEAFSKCDSSTATVSQEYLKLKEILDKIIQS